MPDVDPIALVVAIAGLITAVFGPAALVLVALINRDKTDEPEPDPVEQGQTVKPDARLMRERNAYRRALDRANDRLAEAGLPLEHADF